MAQDTEITIERVQSWTIVVRHDTTEDGLDWVQGQLNIRGRDEVSEFALAHEPTNVIWQTNGHETLEHDDGHDPDFDQHSVRPCDHPMDMCPSPGCCKDCGQRITWIGGWGDGYEHEEDS